MMSNGSSLIHMTYHYHHYAQCNTSAHYTH